MNFYIRGCEGGGHCIIVKGVKAPSLVQARCAKRYSRQATPFAGVKKGRVVVVQHTSRNSHEIRIFNIMLPLELVCGEVLVWGSKSAEAGRQQAINVSNPSGHVFQTCAVVLTPWVPGVGSVGCVFSYFVISL